ncbi:MAG: hypothetical protein KatS3mg061_0311 [Dehalococcoidia bacterium]|nr:MAG: hypothetical protein KatS3mg061_0311 [Dehalococcoidia bacterium]
MLRKTLAEKRVGLTSEISWRGHDILRIEALTDVAFGFALTLLVVAAEVPPTFNALVGTLVHFPAFVLSFSILLALWHAHYQFFRRFGMEDGFVFFINSIFLFVVLFYAYPLKFLFTLNVDALLDLLGGGLLTESRVPAPIAPGQEPLLMTFYGAGLIAAAACFVLLYHHALRHATILALSPAETVAVRTEIAQGVGRIVVAALSILVAWITRDAAISGLVYLAYPFIGRLGNRWQRAQLARLAACEPLASSSQVS